MSQASQPNSGDIITTSSLTQHFELAEIQLFISQIPGVVALYKTEALIIAAASDTWLKSTHRTKEVIGQPLHVALPELMSQGVPEMLLSVFRTGEAIIRSEYRLEIMQDGKPTEAYFDATYSAIKSSEGEIIGVLAMGTEVTEKVLAKKEQQKLLAMVDNSSDFIGLSGPDNTIVYLNVAARKLVGIPLDADVSGMSSKLFYSPEQYQYIRNEIIPVLEKEGTWQGPVSLIHHQTEEIIPCHGSYILVKDEKGTIISRGATIRDLRGEIARGRELAHSEERFRKTIQDAPVAIGLMRGADMIVETANNDILRLWGKNETVIGLPIVEALPEIKGQGLLELLQSVYTTGEPYYGYEMQVKLAHDGGLRDFYFNFVYAPVRDVSGVINGVVVVATEVSEQVKTRQELEKSERRFRNLIEEAPVATGLYIGREMRIAFVNEAMAYVWGKDKSVIGKTIREALPELDGQPFHQLLDDVFTTGKEYKASADRVDLVVDNRLQTFYYNFVYYPLRDEDGKVYAILNMAIDVTAQHEATKKVEETEERLRIAIESAELGTWTINLKTQEAFLSDRLKTLYGFEGDTVDIMSGFNSIHEKDRERVFATMMAATQPEAGGIYQDEYAIRNQITGKIYEIRAAAKVVFDGDGNAEFLVGTIQDITDQKMAELELEARVEERTEALRRANVRLQQSNQNLQQFAYVSSHDLQEPLRKILIFSGMLRDSQLIPTDSREHQHAEKISASAQRMQRLIRDLLDYSRADIKEQLFEPVNLNKVLRNILQDFELLIIQKDAEMQVGELPMVKSIPLQMNQLLYNLIGNALKFTKKGRKPVITISSSYPNKSELRQHENINPSWTYCLIKVSDNGIGFDPAFSDKIFTVFQRLHNRDEYEGTGIGLALCKKIAENHGGELTVESEEDKGATFSILLPVSRG